MNIQGFENTKAISDKIQELTEGEVVSNTTGTNNVNHAMDNDISDFNKGVEVMTNINLGDYHVRTEGVLDGFKKKPKSGAYHPDPEEYDENPIVKDIRSKNPSVKDTASYDPDTDPFVIKTREETESEKRGEEMYNKMQQTKHDEEQRKRSEASIGNIDERTDSDRRNNNNRRE